jgi:hypothetical protein
MSFCEMPMSLASVPFSRNAGRCALFSPRWRFIHITNIRLRCSAVSECGVEKTRSGRAPLSKKRRLYRLEARCVSADRRAAASGGRPSK